MPCVMKSNEIAIIVINARTGNNWSTKVTADVFNCDIWCAQVWLCTNIKAVFMLVERRSEPFRKLLKENFPESNAKKVIVKVFNRSSWSEVTSAPFRNKDMYMRIPFEIPAKGMQNTDESRSKEFRLIHQK